MFVWFLFLPYKLLSKSPEGFIACVAPEAKVESKDSLSKAPAINGNPKKELQCPSCILKEKSRKIPLTGADMFPGVSLRGNPRESTAFFVAEAFLEKSLF